MGVSNSKQPNFVKEIRKEAHPLLGDISQTMLTDTNTRAIMKVYSSSDEGAHKERLRKLRHRLNRPSPYLLNLLRVEESNNSDFCGITGRIYCFYECFDQDLEGQYHERLHKKQRFSEDQLIDIATAVLGGLIFIQDNEMRRCHLTKKSVVYAGEKVKILDQSLVQKLHPYYLLLQREELEDDVFLSPELLWELSRSNLDPYISPKSDIFTLGMLLFHIASLESLRNFYDYEQFTVDVESARAKIDRLGYSSGFRCLLKMMIDENQETRPGVITLQERLAALIKCPGGNIPKKIPEACFTIDPEEHIPLVITHKHSKTSRSSVNIASQPYCDLDIVKTSDDRFPVMLRIPNRTFEPMNVSAIPPPSRTEAQSVTDYSTIVNKLQKHNTYLLEDQTEGQTHQQQNLGNTGQFGESPIRKINGLMDTFRQSTDNTRDSRYGKVNCSQGGYYEGELKNGEPHGNGILYFMSGKVSYSGSWSNGVFDGFGTLQNECPIESGGSIQYKNFDVMQPYSLRYEGEFRQGSKEGFGSIYYSNGEKFSGCFKKDKADGYGTFYCREGQPLNGVWHQNRFDH